MSAKMHGQRIIILLIVAAFFVSSLSLTGFVLYDMITKKDQTSQADATADAQKQLEEQIKKQQEQQAEPNTEGIKVESTDIAVGSGAEAVAGKKVTVHYSGTLKDGTKFDSSVDRGQPFSFTLGAGEVIKGWDQGVAGMKVGGKRKLVIPAVLAYGEQSPSEKIPPNSDLVFEIELLKVE